MLRLSYPIEFTSLFIKTLISIHTIKLELPKSPQTGMGGWVHVSMAFLGQWRKVNRSLLRTPSPKTARKLTICLLLVFCCLSLLIVIIRTRNENKSMYRSAWKLNSFLVLILLIMLIFLKMMILLIMKINFLKICQIKVDCSLFFSESMKLIMIILLIRMILSKGLKKSKENGLEYIVAV